MDVNNHMDTLVNFRDIGGYSTLNGRVVKRNQFFRSGEPVKLSIHDQQALSKDYKIQLMVDFRKKQEAQEHPDDTIDGIRYCRLDILEDSNAGAGFSDFMNSQNDPDHMMKELYQELVVSKSAQHGYHTFINLLLEQKNMPVLFHCFAGKDRTGMAAAIILSILGVSQDDIMEDYLKTNVQRKTANDQLIEEARQNGMKDAEIERIETLMYVKKEYLEEAFSMIKKEYGSFRQYILEGLALPASVFEDMQKLYTELPTHTN